MIKTLKLYKKQRNAYFIGVRDFSVLAKDRLERKVY